MWIKLLRNMKSQSNSAIAGAHFSTVSFTTFLFFSLYHVTLGLDLTSVSSHKSLPYLATEDFNQQLAKLLEKQKDRILETHVLSLSPSVQPSRKKREIGSQLYRDSEGFSKLQGIQRFGGIAATVIDAVSFRAKNHDYVAVCTTAAVNNTYIYLLNQNKTFESMVLHLDIPDAKMLAISVMKNEDIKLIGAGNTEVTGGTTIWNVVFDAVTGRAFSSRGETLATTFPNYVTTWNQYDTSMLAVANSYTVIGDGKDYATEVVIYHNRQSYYDRLDSVRAFNPQKVSHFMIANRHYLLVCNFPNVTSGYKIQSELFEFSLSQGVYLFFQKIPTEGCLDADHFTIGVGPKLEHYIVVANLLTFKNGGVVYNDVQSVIYKYVQGMFIPFQGIPTYHVNSVLAYQSSKRDLLLIFGSASGLDMYSYTGFRFVHCGSFGQDILGAEIVRIRSLDGIDPNYFIVANKNLDAIGKPNIFLPEFRDEPPLAQYYTETTQWCLAQLDVLAKEQWIEPLYNIYNTSVKLNDTGAHLANAHFAHIEVDNAYTDVLRHNNSQLDLSNIFVSRLLDADRQTEAAYADLQALKNSYARVLRKEGHFELAGPLFVDNLKSSCTDRCRVQSIQATKAHGIDLEELLQNAISLSAAEIGSLDLAIVEIQGNVYAPHWSGINLVDILTTTHNVSLNGVLKVDGDVHMIGPVYVGGLLDGVKVTAHDLLLKSGDQTINWALHADALTTRGLDISSGIFNELNLNFYLDKAVTRTSGFTLSQPRFLAEVAVNRLVFGSVVNNVDISNMYYNALRLYGDQLISGTHYYGIMSVNGNVTVGNYVGGHAFPENFILNDGGEYTVRGSWEFTNDTQFINLEVLEKLNTIDVVDSRLDLLSLDQDNQVVTGKKIFSNVTSYGPVVADTYNGVTMAYFVSDNGVHGERGGSIVLDNVLADLVEVHLPLTVADFKGVDLQRLKNHGLMLDREMDYDNIAFQSVKVHDFHAVTINNVPTSSFVIKRDPHVFFTAGKTFNNHVIFSEAAHVESTVNGLDLSAIRDTVMLKSGDQHVVGHTVVEGDLLAEMVRADVVSVSGQNLESFVRKDFAGLVTGVKTFASATIQGNLSVVDLSAERVDGVSVSDLVNDTLLVTGENLIMGINTFPKLTVLENVAVGSFKHFDIDSLLSNIALKSQPIHLQDDLAFSSSFICYSAQVDVTIDGVQPDAIFHWMLQDVNQTFKTVNVAGNALVELMEDPTWVVHDGSTSVDLFRLIDTSYRVNEDVHIPQATFDTLVVEKLITPSVNNVSLGSGVVLRKSVNPQRLSGTKNFGNLTVERLQAHADFAAGDPSQFCDSQFIQQALSWTVLGDVVLDDTALTLDSLIDYDMEQLMTGVWMDDEDVVLKDSQLFEEFILEKAAVIGTINGLDMATLNQRRIQLNATNIQQITASHSYDEIVSNQGFVNHLSSHNVNEYDIDHIRASALTKDTDQEITAPMVFSNVIANRVISNGLLNTVNLTIDVMLKDKANVVTGPKTFVELQSTEDVKLAAEALVDNVHIPQLEEEAVMLFGTFDVTGHLTFVDGVQFIQPLQVLGTLNDRTPHNSNLMSLSQNQVIDTNMVFSSAVPLGFDSDNYAITQLRSLDTKIANLAATFSMLQVDGSYQGVDLNRFFTKTVRTNVTNNFTSYVFINGLDIDEVNDNADRSTIQDILLSDERLGVVVSDGLTMMERGALLGEYLSNLNSTLANQACVFLYYQEVATSSPILEVKSAVPVFDQLTVAALAEQSIEFYYLEKESLVKSSHALPLRSTTKVASSDNYMASVSNVGGYVYEFDGEFFVQRGQISLTQGSDVTTLRLNGSDCFLFTDRSTASSPIMCKSGSATDFTKVAELPASNIQQVAVTYVDDVPTLAIVHAALPSLTNFITTWKYSLESSTFVSGPTIYSSSVRDLDIVAYGGNILVAVASSAQPLTAVRGEVSIWRLDEFSRQSFRSQRIVMPNPSQVWFAAQPCGQLMVLVQSGCDTEATIKVHTYAGLGGFKEQSAILAPHARGFFVSQSDTDTTVFANREVSGGIQLTVLRAIFAGGDN